MVLLLLLLALCLSGAAQEPRGTITGQATDATRAVAPGVAVKATNIDTGVSARAVTNNEGHYEIPFLIPGPYRMEAALDGFKTWVQPRIEVRMEDVVRVDILLETGSVTETLNVTAEAPLVESTSGNVGQVMESEQIGDMPLRSGSLAWAYSMAPGVVMNDRPFDGPWNIDQASNVSVGGSRGYGADYNVDGVSNNAYGGRTAFVPPPDMVQELRVNVAGYDASLGRATGASVNVSLKSGTNKLHGSANVSGSGGPLMTRNFFTNRFLFDPTTGPVTPEKIAANTPAVRWMRYSGAVGGPLVIPRVYNGRNRTFWMFGYQTHNRVRPQATLNSVPAKAHREGDFSNLLAVGAAYQIYDPATTTPEPAGARLRRQPFAGNVIPPSRIHPVSRRISRYYPLPNTAGTPDGLQNFSYTYVAEQNLTQPLIRFDHNFSESHRMFARYAQSNFSGIFDRIIPDSPVRGRLRGRPYRGAALDDVAVLNSRLVLDVRYGFTWFKENERFSNQGWDLSEFGFPASLTRVLDPAGITFPELAVNDVVTIGNNGGFYQTNYSHTLLATLNQMRGSHSIKYGFDGRLLYANEMTRGNVSPRLNFAENYTRGPLDNSAAAPVGQGFASFLLGLHTGGYADRNDSRAATSGFYTLFVQDDWRAARRLTLNAGLRWEYESPVRERWNRFTRGFDFNTPNPIEAAARAAYARSPIPEIPVESFRTAGGVLFAGVGGVPNRLREPFRRAFMPRLGFAWAWKPRVVLRGGYGIFYDLLGVDFTDVPQTGFNQQTNTVTSLDTGVTYVGSISNPFPFGLVAPAGASAGLMTYLGRAPGFRTDDGRRPYVQRWSFNVQAQPMRLMMVELGYLASRGVRLRVNRDVNAVPRQYLSTLPARDQPVINLMTANFPNPFAGIAGFDGSNLYTARNTNRTQLLRPYPHFQALTADGPAGSSWYHALTARLERRFGRGLFVQANYTWARFMQASSYLNPTDSAPEHVIGRFDRPHRLSVTGMYTLPFAARSRGAVRALFAGWQAVALYNCQSGPALGFGNAIYHGAYPEIRLPLGERTVDRWFNTQGFVTATGQQLAQNIRTMPSRISAVRADGINVWDLSLQKTFPLREGVRLQVRAQAEGAMNHPNFAVPNTTPTSTLFGRVSGTQGAGQEERRLFLGLKLTF